MLENCSDIENVITPVCKPWSVKVTPSLKKHCFIMRFNKKDGDRNTEQIVVVDFKKCPSEMSEEQFVLYRFNQCKEILAEHF